VTLESAVALAGSFAVVALAEMSDKTS